MMTQYDEILQLREQRDELVAALKEIEALPAFENMDYGQQTKLMARAALAKVTV